MRIGVTLPFGASDGPGRLPTWREMHAFATHAEAIGLDSLWVCDHFLSGPAGRPAEAIHEGWTIVAALAASTSTIELGQLVMCVSFRSAALLPPPDRPIPILVAGNRPRMLRLTARYADAWNTAWFGLPDKWLGQRLAGLHAALQAESRDPATLRRPVGMDCELTDPDQAGGGSFASLADGLARAI